MQSKLHIYIIILLSSYCGRIRNDIVGRPLSIANFPVKNEWREEEKAIPIILAPVPPHLPSEYRIESFPEPGDQGIQASGSAWAISQASSIRKLPDGASPDGCSPAFLYNMLNGGKNEGIELHRGLELFRSNGCSPERLMPYIPNDYSQRPTGEAFAAALNNKIAGFGRVDFRDINQIKGHLIQNSAVLVTLTVFQNFLILSRPLFEAPSGKPAGRHSITVIGYDDARRAFLIQNSAGLAWGERGRCWIPYDWFIRLTSSAFVLW